MIPIILYAPNTTDFSNNGLGVLNEATSAIVTEERNGIFELTVKYPITGKRYSDIQYSSVLRCASVPQGDYQTFRVYAISKPMNGLITISAEHVSYQLSYIVANAFTATTAAEAMVKIKTNAMTTCPFDFWTDKTTTGTYNQEVPENIRSRLGGVSGSILDVYGGEYEFDNYTVKLHENRGQNRGVTLRYGKNITNIEQEENIESVYTSIVGYWKSEDDMIKTDVINSSYVSSYPFNRTKVVDFSSEYQEAPTVAQLTSRATSYMTSNSFGVPKISIKVSFVALWQTEEYKNVAPLERVYLCDTVNVYFEKLGITAQAKVVKTVYNVLLDRYDSIELGEARTNLSGRLANNVSETAQKLKETKSELEKSIDRATEIITGNRGGYIVTRMDANGKPTELLIMDTDDVETAQKVWRFNLSGWGYSSTGINGPYRLAATQDGHIVADFVDTGTLTANVIKAGILTDSAGKFSLNMTTGALDMKDGTFRGTITGSEVNGGTITGSEVNGGTITGSTIQNAKTGSRVLIDSSSSLKGYQDNTLHNLINLSNQNSNNNDLIIDADHQLHIRTPKIYVATSSYGTGGGTVYETKTGTGSSGLEFITSVSKKYDYKDVYCGSYNEDEGEVYCHLPVILNVNYAKYDVRHGMWMTGNSTRSDTI